MARLSESSTFYLRKLFTIRKAGIRNPTCGEIVNALNKINKEKLLIRACHICLKLNESVKELERCSHCNKPFLPLRYFEKIHHDKDLKWANHFSSIDQIEEEDLIKGLFVLW